MIEIPGRPVFEPPVGLPRRGIVRFVDVPERRLLAVDGEGAPGGRGFQDAFQALYSTAYTLHFLLKKAGRDPGDVGALEGLWERTDATAETPFAEAGDPEAWRWRVMLPMPRAATDADLAAAIQVAAAKKEIPALAGLVLLTWTEGPCVEALHVGPYATERETIDRMLAAASEHGLRPHGAHHEIYVGDPRRSDPAKLRTVLRQPVA